MGQHVGLVGVCLSRPLSSRDSRGGYAQESAAQEAMGIQGLGRKRGKCSQKSGGRTDSNKDVSREWSSQ